MTAEQPLERLRKDLVKRVRSFVHTNLSTIVELNPDHCGLGMGELPTPIASLMERQLAVMDLNVEAAVTGDRQTALEGLVIDPLMPDPKTAEKILDEMLVAQADYLPQFK